MVTKAMAVAAGAAGYAEFCHVKVKNAKGRPAVCRRNGKCQTWKTRPADFRLPVKYGLKECFDITPNNAADWVPAELAEYAGEMELEMTSPLGIIADKLRDAGRFEEADKLVARWGG